MFKLCVTCRKFRRIWALDRCGRCYVLHVRHTLKTPVRGTWDDGGGDGT